MLARTTILVIVLFSLLPFSSAEARVWVLQADGTGDAPTIAAAIDSVADAGDVIELVDGTYTGDGNRDLEDAGKLFVLRSQSGNPTACIIDLQGSAADPHWGIIYSDDG